MPTAEGMGENSRESCTSGPIRPAARRPQRQPRVRRELLRTRIETKVGDSSRIAPRRLATVVDIRRAAVFDMILRGVKEPDSLLLVDEMLPFSGSWFSTQR